MAEIRINATGGVKLYDADDSHYAQIVAGTITSNVDAITLGHDTVTIADNLSLGSDSSVLKFGADGDTTLTHTDGTGLTLNSTNKLCFNDASQFIQGASATVLDIAATDEIELTATEVEMNVTTLDVNGATDLSGALTIGGVTSFPDGSAGSPSITNTGDTNTGMYFAAADTVAWSTGGTERMRIEHAGNVGIGTTSASAKLHLMKTDTGALNDANSDDLMIEDSNAGICIGSATDGEGHIYFSDSDDSDVGAISYFHGSNYMQFRVNAAERMRIDSSGNVLIGATDTNPSANNVAGTAILSSGFISACKSADVPADLCRKTNDGNLINFRQDGTIEGVINVSGTTVGYGTFCGTHWSRLSDNSKPTILRGTVMESIATMMDWYQAASDVAESTDGEGNVTPAHQVKENVALPDGKSVGDSVTFTSGGEEYTGVYVKEDNEQLPMCKISDTADSKAVYGVFMAWDDTDDGNDGDVNDMYIAALGAFVVRVHSGETVAIGDYLQSKGDGTAKVQADDILRASTIAKVTSTTKTITHGDGSYCVPCTLHCG